MTRPRRFSLQLVLVAAFALVALVTIAFLSAHRYVWATADLLEDELEHDLSRARSVALVVDQYLARRRHFVEGLAAEVATLALAHRPALRTLLDGARRRDQAFAMFVVLDAAGTVVAASPATDADGRPHVGKQFVDPEWFRGALRGGSPASYNVITPGIVNRPGVAIAAPIRSFAASAAGVFLGVLNLEPLRESVRAIDGGRRDRLVVLDAQGRVVVHGSHRWEDAAHDLSGIPVFLAAKRAVDGTTRYLSPFTGSMKWSSYARVPSSGWVAYNIRDVEIAETKLLPLVRGLALSGLVALVLAVGASFVLTRILVRPLRVLAEATRTVSHGGIPKGELVTERDSRIAEFSELLAGFGAMAERLRGQYGELEAKVAERTTALERAAHESQAAAALLRTQDQIRRGYGELTALLNSLDRSHILHESTRKIAASLRAPTVAVYLTDDGARGLRLKTYAALDPGTVDATLLSPAGLPSEVAQRGEAIVLNLLHGGERLRLMTGIGTIDVAVVAGLPLYHQDRLLGVLAVALLAPLTEDTRSFLENTARQLSVALSNAELYESVRFQSQQMERLNAELRHASEMKSQFLASMSHELRTPLNSIIGFTELLLMSGRDPLSERQRTALEKVHTNARHQLALINDVLDIARIQAGRMDVNAEAFVLDALVRECVTTVEPQAQAKSLLLRVVGLEQAPALVQDRSKVKQILINLLSNAVTFTPSGSVEVRVGGGPDVVTIAVVDTGIGIPFEDQSMIFEEFRRGDAADASRTPGTGLGLAISRRLAHLMRGTLTVDSAPDRGSVFTLRLPVRHASTAPVTTAPGELDAGPPGLARILVIDDDNDVVEIIRQALAADPFRIEAAASAREGLARARARRPALILLDLVLQGNDDGWGVLQQLKADPATRDIPVVIHSMIDNAARARRLGADEVIVKPVAPSTLRHLLASLVTEAQAVGAAELRERA